MGLRPRAEAWGSAVETGRGGSALEPAEGGGLGAGGLTKLCLRASVASGSLSDENDSSSGHFLADEESWNAGKLSPGQR